VNAPFVATKFGREYEQRVCDEDCAEFLSGAQRDEQTVAALLEAAKTMREALQDAWLIFDRLGQHAPDDDRLAVLRGADFASAAFRVRAAMLKSQRLEGLL
jgi:hypothetical protein